MGTTEKPRAMDRCHLHTPTSLPRRTSRRNPDVTLRRPHIADRNPEARLRVTTRGSRVHNIVLGPAMDLTGDAAVDKFRANAAYVFDREWIARPVQLVQRLEAIADVGELMDAVTVSR